MGVPEGFQEQERFIKRLESEGRKLAWALNSTVYELEGQRWLVFTLLQHERRPREGPFRVEALSLEWGVDAYAAKTAFLDAFRGFKKI